MSELYERDYLAWTVEQADALERRSANEVDWENLREEIRDLGLSQRRALESRLRILIAHLLKWRIQPDRQSSSWVFTIGEQRRAIQRLLMDNPSLAPTIADVLAEVWSQGAGDAAYETGHPEGDFPDAPVFDFADAMSTPIALDERADQRRSSVRSTKA